MKIQVDRDVLAEAVAWVARSLPTRPSVPILAGLLIRTDGDTVVLSSFDYETSAKITVKAQVDEPGEVLISGRLLSDICRSLPNQKVNLTSDETSLRLVCGPARFTLQTLPVSEYPALPDMPEATGKVSSNDFAEAVSQVVVAAGRDELLPVFTGVRVELEGDTLSLLATDRYRMALRELPWQPSAGQAEGAALVPAKVLNESAKSMVAGDDVTLSLGSTPGHGDGSIGFAGTGHRGDDREITTRLLDGEFPKVRHLMNVQPSVSVRCNTADLLAAVRRVALVAERNTALIMLLQDDHITLEAAAGDQAQGVEAVDATVTTHAEGGLTKAGFNASYLQDALNVMATPFVHFSFSMPGKPALLRGLDSMEGEPREDYRHVIMLMRIPS